MNTVSSRRPQRRTSAPHGTHARYTAGCSCIPCCDAHNAYVKAQAAGELPRRIDASRTRAHIRCLQRSGMSYGAIARYAGDVSRESVRQIGVGMYPTVRSDIAEAIAAVVPIPTRLGVAIPAAPTIRLVERILAQTGMTRARLERRVGCKVPAPGRASVRAKTALAVRELASELGLFRASVDYERVDIMLEEGFAPEDIEAAGVCNARTVYRRLAQRETAQAVS